MAAWQNATRFKVTRQFAPKLLVTLAVLLGLAACQDPMNPLDQGSIAGPQFDKHEGEHGKASRLPPMLQQSSTAPSLQTYQVSFWVKVRKGASVAVNYQPVRGYPQGEPFMQFDIPPHSIIALGDTRLVGKDSVLITATIDTVNFQVAFQPEGLKFSSVKPATLTMWWENANLDLNDNGVVDGWDWKQLEQLSFWYITNKNNGVKLKSINDIDKQYVSTSLYHFSQYSVSW